MVRVTVRFRSHETPDTDPKQSRCQPEELSVVHKGRCPSAPPGRAQCTPHGPLPDSRRIWVPRPNKCMGHPLGRPQDSSPAAAVTLWK